MAQLPTSHIDTVDRTIRSAGAAAASAMAASWRRSALHHGLDPAAKGRRDPLSGEELGRRLEENEELLTVALPLVDQMFRTVGQSGCSVLLSDADGVILRHRVLDVDDAVFARMRLTEGYRWSEADEGTNGIGTCLFEDRPVTVHRDQHFAVRNIGISCMDAPIHDPMGRLIGALDVSSCRRDHDTMIVTMISALVRDAAKRIEREYFCNHFKHARIIFVGEDAVYGSALLAIDEDGLAIGATWAARQSLRLKDCLFDQPRSVDEVLGESSQLSFALGDRAVLRKALAQAGGNASQAAKLLGIGRATFYRRMARAGLRD